MRKCQKGRTTLPLILNSGRNNGSTPPPPKSAPFGQHVFFFRNLSALQAARKKSGHSGPCGNVTRKRRLQEGTLESPSSELTRSHRGVNYEERRLDDGVKTKRPKQQDRRSPLALVPFVSAPSGGRVSSGSTGSCGSRFGIRRILAKCKGKRGLGPYGELRIPVRDPQDPS